MMRLGAQLRSWISSVIGRPQIEREMDAELRFHLEAYAEDLVRRGVPRNEARRRARIEFGGVELAKEECREARGSNVMESLFQDLRFACRSLRKSPGFALTAIVMLALGIGANTAIFSLVNTILLRPLPYRDADRLVMVWSDNRTRGDNTDLISPLDFADWRTENHVFENMAASTDVTYTLTGVGNPALIIAYSFSPDFFHVLGVAPIRGRTFLPEEEQEGKNRVCVLSYSFWQKRLGGDEGAVGRTISLDGMPYSIVGVMPAEFQYPSFTELWTPLTIPPEAAGDRSYRYLRVMARLKPGVTQKQAQAEMNAIAARLAVAYPTTNKEDDGTNLVSLRQNTVGDIRPALMVLLWAVGFVLLIACANIGNLLLARTARRRQEVAVRVALGASGSRIVRQLLTESILVGLLGGAVGIGLASLCTRMIVTMFPPSIFNLNIPHIEQISIDGSVLAFTLVVSILTGVLFGLVPAIQAARNGGASMKQSGRGLAGAASPRRFRGALIASEVALSLILLMAAGLMLRSFVHLLRTDLGFRADHVLTLRVLPPSSKYKSPAERIAFGEQIAAKLHAIPGVQAAGAVTFLPLSGWRGQRGVALADLQTPQSERIVAMWSSVMPQYFRAMQIPLLEGREFNEHDRQGAPVVAILSRALAHQLAPNSDLLGKRIEVEGHSGAVEVVGIVGDVHHLGITEEITSELYLPFSQLPAPILCFALRTAGDPESVAKDAELAVWSVDKDQAIAFLMSMNQLASESLAPERVLMLMLMGFGVMALSMAGVGIYGVIANSVAERTNEIGIRMSLGAQPAGVLRLVVGQGIRWIAIGLTLGLVGIATLMRFLSSTLYGVRSSDPLTLAFAVALLAGLALLACYLPARRATRVDPIVALRYE